MSLNLEDVASRGSSGRSSELAVQGRDSTSLAPTWGELARELGQNENETTSSDGSNKIIDYAEENASINDGQNEAASVTSTTATTTTAPTLASLYRRIMGQQPDGSSPSEKSRAPSPPRWRFVNEAKSTAGYSTDSAGRFVRGKTADELGAKYTAPDISLYKERAEREDPGKLLLREWKRKQVAPPPEEEFGGLPKLEPKSEETKQPFKEWDETYPVGPKKTRETEWWDGEISEFYKTRDDQPPGKARREVGKLPRNPPGNPENEDFDGQYMRGKIANENESASKSDDAGSNVFTAFSIDKANSICSADSFRNEFAKKRLNKKEKCLFLLILLMLLLVIILGIIMGTNRSNSKVAEVPVVAGILAAAADSNSTDVPSTSPTTLYLDYDVDSPSSSSPTSTPTKFPTSGPTVNPPNPSNPPEPTNPPEIECSNERDFNLCFAIDMSGSVCNNGWGDECIQCSSLFCGDFFVSSDVCCYNFWDVIEFSKAMVESLGDFPSEQSFSVVQFATDSALVSSLSSKDQTLQALDQMEYAGGLTNHAAGIQLCQETFVSSEDPERKNFIMLITDGEPTVPEYDPEAAASEAARNARLDGTFIMPVFISPTFDSLTQAFMRGLSSDGQVFDVGDFESLSSLQERLVNQVSCQS